MSIVNLSRFIVDSVPVEFSNGDSLLSALLRAGKHPTGGGCLCCAGDCPHCLATVDGVSYVRTCQTPAKPGMVVERHHTAGAYPPLPVTDRPAPEIDTRHLFCDVVVIGMGESGQLAAAEAIAAGKSVITLDASAGQEVISIYPGPQVVARTDEGMLQVHPSEEIIVATGAAKIQPVVAGNHLQGILTLLAAEKLSAAGVKLGRVVAIGAAPSAVDAELVTGELVRFEGSRTLEAVVVSDGESERRIRATRLSSA